MKKAIALVLTLAMLFTLAACGGTTATTPSPTPPASAPTPSGSPDGGAPAGEVLKIGAITSLSGALQDYGEQFRKGFLIGLDYMTGGTNVVAGRPIEIVWEDTTNTPDVAKERTLKLLEQDKVEIVVGYASSGDAVACLPLFEEYETVAIVEPAAADALITQANWNEYMFRTGRTSGQDALAMVSVITSNTPNATIACFAPDTTYGYGMVDPFVKAAKAAGHTIVATEYAPMDANDFSPYLLRIKDLAPDYMYVSWAGANNPWTQIVELDMASATTITTGAPELAQLRAMAPLGDIGGIGFCLYYNELPKNEVNDFLVKRHQEQYKSVPDIFAPGGMAAAIALCTALEKTGGSTDARTLISTMEGMEFNSPTGTRRFRPEDHQAMQVLYEVTFTNPGKGHMVPAYVRDIPAAEITPPITNGRG